MWVTSVAHTLLLWLIWKYSMPTLNNAYFGHVMIDIRNIVFISYLGHAREIISGMQTQSVPMLRWVWCVMEVNL